MKLMLRTDFSPCSAKDPDSGVGIPLVPGTMLDTDVVGIVDPAKFVKTYRWAFEADVEDMSARPGKKRAATHQPS